MIYWIKKNGAMKAKKFQAIGTCFGTLISEKHVLTKADCILKDKGKKWKVKSKIENFLIAQVIRLLIRKQQFKRSIGFRVSTDFKN